ncbi:hypothetical protein [Mycobacterium sherrisii]|uniref:hypothetical protein n=1 Tax=Mycobacterium sherrisii TaxID=243061 RepID=UPI0012F50155|nr:hypothetical protein [Mycobacterium sherrisii]
MLPLFGFGNSGGGEGGAPIVPARRTPHHQGIANAEVARTRETTPIRWIAIRFKRTMSESIAREPGPPGGDQHRAQIAAIDVPGSFAFRPPRERPGHDVEENRTLIGVTGVERAPRDAGRTSRT